MTREQREQLEIFLEQHNFVVHESELETWTDGGVNMIIQMNPFTVESFKAYVYGFDVDAEIDLYRNDVRYCQSFTIRQSLEDFEAFQARLQQVLQVLNLQEKA